MKRKFILIFAVLLFCSGIYMAARGLQTKSINESQTENQSSTIDVQKAEGDKSDVNNASVQTEVSKQENTNNNSNNAVQKPNNQTKPPETNSGNTTPKQPVAAVNFKVIDTIKNTTILSISADLENKTVGEVTTKLLDSKGIDYRARGAGDTIYFSSIAGLTETKAGPESGWCYYVNGTKYSIGAGNYKLKKGDIVEWKYLKDGIGKD